MPTDPTTESPQAAQRCREAVAQATRFLDRQVAEAALARQRVVLPTHDLEAFLAAAEPRRQVLRQLLALDRLPPAPVATLRRQPLQPPFETITWQPLPDLAADAVAARSDATPRATILLLHPLTGSPEAILEPTATGPLPALARALLTAGCQLVVPRWINDWQVRQRVARQARLLGLEWTGIELVMLQRLVDALLLEGSVTAGQLGVCGFSRGGQLALLLAATDARICATACQSWFCHRVAKLLDTGDQRLASYLESPEDEQFVPGWLTAFTDASLAFLAAPEPLLITHGTADPITPWEHVEAAFGPVAELYDALGFGELAKLVIHPGGHEPAVAATLAFFAKWLELPELWQPRPRSAVTTARRKPRLGLATMARRVRARRSGRRGSLR